MIYIYKDKYPPFIQLANVISKELNCPYEITDDFSKDGIWIVFFTVYLYNREKLEGKKYIAVQTENINESTFLRRESNRENYKAFLNNAIDVWDYTENFKLGYSSYYEIEKENSKEIDVLFYGAMNPRRDQLLKKIPNCKILNDGEEFFPKLWNMVLRTKIVVYVDFYEKSHTNTVRICPLLSNRIFFIAERSTHDPDIKDYVTAKYEDIPKMCEYFLSRPEERLEYIERGYNYIKNNPVQIPKIDLNY